MLRVLQSIVVLLTIMASGVAALPPRTAHAATQAVPGTDPNFYKLAVSQSGLTQVTYEALDAAGVPVTSLTPATIQIYEQGWRWRAMWWTPTAAGRSTLAITSCSTVAR